MGVVSVVGFIGFFMILSFLVKKYLYWNTYKKKMPCFMKARGVLCEASYTVEDSVGVGTDPSSLKPRLRFLARFFFALSLK